MGYALFGRIVWVLIRTTHGRWRPAPYALLGRIVWIVAKVMIRRRYTQTSLPARVLACAGVVAAGGAAAALARQRGRSE